MTTTAAPESATGFHPLPVAAVDRLTDDSVAVTFDVPPGLADAYRFTPGQHLTLRRVMDGQDLRRTYSVCSSVAGGPLRVAVKRLDGGAFSTYVVDALRPGDTLEVLPPTGRFGPRLEPAAEKHYVLVGAGSGITPLLSIAASVLDVEPRSRVTLLYGNRTSRDVMFLDELHDLKDQHPERLRLHHVLSREEQEAELFSGRIDAARMRRFLDVLLPVADVDEWYLCGPFLLVTEARDVLLAAGVQPTSLHLELFHADPPPRRERPADAAGAHAVVTALLAGRASSVELSPDETVLDGVLRVRGDAPFACKGGVCGTCRARVVEGEVEMDVNYALEPDELAAGLVLTCQARPTTDRVRVEFV